MNHKEEPKAITALRDYLDGLEPGPLSDSGCLETLNLLGGVGGEPRRRNGRQQAFWSHGVRRMVASAPDLQN